MKDVITACTMDCPDACSLVVRVAQERAVKLRGNPAHPFTAGFTCRKIRQHLTRLQSPQRICHPLIRRGDGWQRVSWEAALDLCARKISALRETPAAIAHVRAAGATGVTKEAVALFFRRLGATETRGSLCDAAGIAACREDFGSRRNPHPDDLFEARRLVNWGKDLARSSIHLAARVRAVRKQGVSVLAISPSAEGHRGLCDRHILIRPGSDRLLAAAVVRRLIADGRVAAHVIRRVGDWTAFKSLILAQDETELLRGCGVSAADLACLYDAYTARGATATIVGAGLQRYPHGGENVRFINALALLSGHLGTPGGGVHYHLQSLDHLNLAWSRNADSAARRFLRKPTLGRDLLAARDPRIRMLWINGINVVNQSPNSRLIARAFAQIPFKVAVDAFFNDTVQRADLVLPAALMLEQADLIGSFLHHSVQYARQCVPPPGEARSDLWIMREIGRRLNPPIVLPGPEECMQAALDSPGIDIDLAGLKAQGHYEVPVPMVAYKDLRFDHPDGKARLPLALHSPEESSQAYPLHLLSLINGQAIHSQILAENQPMPPTVWVSPDCPGLAELDLASPVYICSPLGRLRVRVETMDGLHPQAVVYRRGDWMATGGGINQLIEDRPTDLGDGTAYYHQFVRLQNG